jgi:transcriptional regulator with XRE-family HTH domain
MTKDERDEALANLLDARAGDVTDTGLPPLGEEDRAEVKSLIEVADLLWEAGHGAPPLESDPVAAMLGLIPDPRYALDAKALARARKSARLKASELASRLVARGWDVQARDVFRWENQSAADVSPALIKAMAEETGTSVDRLTTSRQTSSEHEAVTAVTRSPKFERLVERWALIQRMPRALAASALESRMLATVHRGDRPDADQLLRSLEALVTAVESGDEPQ